MSTPVIMPRLGQSVESCIIARWHKKVGDKVAVGDELFTYETDKAAFEETANLAGEMLAIFFGEGDEVRCLTNVCVIGTKGEDVSAFVPAGSGSLTSAAPTEAVAQAVSRSAALAASPAQDVDVAALTISPRAKRLAARHHADLRAVAPSGPKGRVIERDIRALIDQGHVATGAAGAVYPVGTAGSGIGGRVGVADTLRTGAEAGAETTVSDWQAVAGLPDFCEEKHSTVRKLIARSMSLSLGTIPQLTYDTSFDATDIVAFRARLKRAKESWLTEHLGLEGASVTINDIVLFVVSRVVLRHPVCNASFQDDKIVFYNHVNLGMAVDTPRGLMVPTIFRADKLSLAEISTHAKMLAAECQRGTILPDRLKDGTFTVSNLGGLGIESFTPVINPPQTAILGVNRLQTSVRDVNGIAVPYPSIGLSLTCDHRAVDGAPAARFLKDLAIALEEFSLLLTK